MCYCYLLQIMFTFRGFIFESLKSLAYIHITEMRSDSLRFNSTVYVIKKKFHTEVVENYMLYNFYINYFSPRRYWKRDISEELIFD